MALHPFQQRLHDLVLAAEVTAPPKPWQPVGRGLIPVGGLQGIGFATDPATGNDLVLVVSVTGHGLFDAVTGEKLERDYDPEEDPDGPDLSCPGLGPVSDVRIPVAGTWGGGLHNRGGGWNVEVASPEWPNHRVLLSNGPWEAGHGKGWWYVFNSVGSTFRAAGFSPSGRTLAVATSSDLTLWRR
ncbi:hypothetical protein F7Q99_34730 [Streptomyces kaniharaensis]|uniref:WD40 repeat domain-containing protein n=1 Tax=Streptomyces kaniharaensis TaxID=212423 RepID=A0A6N7L385_9ACTN|nr:hypothetical protein [Streptomyces kaniharaensis]MQS17199.1 hypothetical protein [Streptomyces kaniharaensis]